MKSYALWIIICLLGLSPLLAQEPAEKPAGEKLRALNQSIWAEEKFFEQDAEAFARSLDLLPESKTSSLSSYRAYNPASSLMIAGITPEMVSLYGNPDHPTELNLVFVNQGDFFGQIPDQDRQKILYEKEPAFKKEMRRQENELRDALTKELGTPRQSFFGVGALREKVYRWDAGDVSLLLCVQPDKYIALRVWPVAMANAQGRPLTRTTDTELKQLLKDNITKRENGDVIIEQIPMINQGPKGYCVPATYERILRYLGLSVDMYTLANCGGTVRGGGTYLEDINRAVGDLLSRSGRDTEKRLPVNFTEIQRWVDRGVPVIWNMMVTADIENESHQFTQQRQSMNPEEWAAKMKKYRLPVGFQPNRGGAHVRMIIGYNKNTGEICYSDSWGPEYAELWMPWEAAKALSPGSGAFQVITW